MKRLFSILLTLLMIMCFVACGDVTPETNLNDDTPTDTKPLCQKQMMKKK